MKTKLAVTLSLVAALTMIIASAQAADRIRVNIPFQFLAEGKTLPAGLYELVRTDNEEALQIVSVKGGPSVDMLIITRVGGDIHTTPRDAHVVFDKVGNLYYLSEFWLPGMDGYVLRVTKEKHTHETINIPN